MAWSDICCWNQECHQSKCSSMELCAWLFHSQWEFTCDVHMRMGLTPPGPSMPTLTLWVAPFAPHAPSVHVGTPCAHTPWTVHIHTPAICICGGQQCCGSGHSSFIIMAGPVSLFVSHIPNDGVGQRWDSIQATTRLWDMVVDTGKRGLFSTWEYALESGWTFKIFD